MKAKWEMKTQNENGPAEMKNPQIFKVLGAASDVPWACVCAGVGVCVVA